MGSRLGLGFTVLQQCSKSHPTSQFFSIFSTKTTFENLNVLSKMSSRTPYLCYTLRSLSLAACCQHPFVGQCWQTTALTDVRYVANKNMIYMEMILILFIYLFILWIIFPNILYLTYTVSRQSQLLNYLCINSFTVFFYAILFIFYIPLSHPIHY